MVSAEVSLFESQMRVKLVEVSFAFRAYLNSVLLYIISILIEVTKFF